MSDATKDAALWSQAVPLRKAALKFGDPQEARLYREIDHTSLVLASLQGIAQSVAANGEPNPQLTDAQKGLGEASRLRRALRDAVLYRLKTGSLVGLGYDVPRRAGDQPYRVPFDVWDGRVSWERDEVEGAGSKFAAVRICKPPSHVAKQRGRPSLQTVIEATFAAMLKDGSIDLDRPVREQVPAVRERIWFMNPSLNRSPKGLADKTLEMALGSLFEAARGSP